MKTTLDGVNQLDYLTGKSEKSARDTFFYYAGRIPLGGALQELEILLHDDGLDRRRRSGGTRTFNWTQINNIMRDPFEHAVGEDQKTAMSVGGAIAAPSTAYLYDWNILPIGQLLWLKELESYVEFPPMQDPASYNLESGSGSRLRSRVAAARANNRERACIADYAGGSQEPPVFLLKSLFLNCNQIWPLGSSQPQNKSWNEKKTNSACHPACGHGCALERRCSDARRRDKNPTSSSS